MTFSKLPHGKSAFAQDYWPWSKRMVSFQTCHISSYLVLLGTREPDIKSRDKVSLKQRLHGFQSWNLGSCSMRPQAQGFQTKVPKFIRLRTQLEILRNSLQVGPRSNFLGDVSCEEFVSTTRQTSLGTGRPINGWRGNLHWRLVGGFGAFLIFHLWSSWRNTVEKNIPVSNVRSPSANSRCWCPILIPGR